VPVILKADFFDSCKTKEEKMKRFWLVLLSLGLVMAFSASVFAADVKFRSDGSAQGPSTALYYQRLRVNMEFIATPALKMITRFDAMERIWGGARSVPGVAADTDSYGTRAENQNIAFDYAYVQYASPIGLWSVGIMSDGAWGTTFGNNDEPEGKIAYMFVKMPFVVGVQIVKLVDNSKAFYNSAPYGTQTDVDADKYQAYVIYNFKGGSVGLLGYYSRVAAARPVLVGAGQRKDDLYGALPYVKAKIGPVAIESEFHYQGGTRSYDTGAADEDFASWYGYFDALADFGMFYAGGTIAYVSGDNTADDEITGNLNAGRDWMPTLIMFNYDLTNWVGAIPGYGTASMSGPMTNAIFGQLRGGVRPIAALDIMGSISYAQAAKRPAGYAEKDYGVELDLTATYKITNNLSYMLGVGYLFTGDYYKAGGTTDVEDNFIVLNKLTLTF
jgi:hypothetical protein